VCNVRCGIAIEQALLCCFAARHESLAHAATDEDWGACFAGRLFFAPVYTNNLPYLPVSCFPVRLSPVFLDYMVKGELTTKTEQNHRCWSAGLVQQMASKP
jgi:hypothetical protein